MLVDKNCYWYNWNLVKLFVLREHQLKANQYTKAFFS